ncbi:MAG: hypothetical protein LBE53_11510 [Paucimonas sp.]|jgi:hypothetical protein|nr:hypothetical protein [Paucimonas sp.]
MSNNFDFQIWYQRLKSCESLSSENESDQFLHLLDEAEKNMSYEVALALISTFSDADDFGVQERTRNVLEAADRHVFYPALIEGLGGLVERSPEKQWALTLVGIEVDYGDFGLLLNYVNKAREKDRSTALSFMRSEDFVSEYPNVLSYLNSI